ncbi:MAG: hypothetical protein MZV65_36640 [Chromatiales bacterium]|nr:hypothetical protein [Chromatiales bacterium]
MDETEIKIGESLIEKIRAGIDKVDFADYSIAKFHFPPGYNVRSMLPLTKKSWGVA